MWKVAFIQLIAILAAGVVVEAFQELDPPANLIIGHFNQSEVWLNWDYEKKPGLPSLGFSVKLWPEVEVPAGDLRESNGTWYTNIVRNLSPGTEYQVEVCASHQGWENGCIAGNFQTMTEDWPSPIIREVTPKVTSSEKYPKDYSILVDLPESKALSHFEIVHCVGADQVKCDDVYSLPATKREFNVIMEPILMDFYVKITAVYKQPRMPQIVKHSAVYRGLTSNAPPGMVTDIMKAENIEHQIEVEWAPLAVLRGPFVDYDIRIYDPENPLEVAWQRVNISKFTTTAPPLKGAYYSADIRAVNVDPTSPEDFIVGDPLSFKIFRYIPPVPKGIRIENRTQYSISFSVETDLRSTQPLFEVQSCPKVQQGTMDSYEGKIYELETYEGVHLKIKACFRPDKNTTLCSGAYETILRSNVAEPSIVRKVRYQRLNVQKFVIHWLEPKHRRGPIDGYIVTIHEKENNIKMRELQRSSSKPRYTFTEALPGRTYEFHVQAYNIDLNDKTIKHIGPSESAEAELLDRSIKWFTVEYVWLAIVCTSGLGFAYLKDDPLYVGGFILWCFMVFQNAVRSTTVWLMWDLLKCYFNPFYSSMEVNMYEVEKWGTFLQT